MDARARARARKVRCRECGHARVDRRIREDQSRNGVRVIVWREKNGTVVDAACSCFGIPGRCHNTESCPLYIKQARRVGAKAKQ